MRVVACGGGRGKGREEGEVGGREKRRGGEGRVGKGVGLVRVSSST